jgi:hypothetical protein
MCSVAMCNADNLTTVVPEKGAQWIQLPLEFTAEDNW